MKCNSEYVRLGLKYKSAKKGVDKHALKAMKLERTTIKKKERMFEQQYNQLKSDLGYKSPECSDASSPAEDDEDSSD